MVAKQQHDFILPYLAIDTETTGLDAHPGRDKPRQAFALCACDHKGNTFYREGNVDPRTLKVTFKRKDIEDFKKLLRQFRVYVFHNAQFDLAMLEAVDPSLLSFFTVWEESGDSCPIIDSSKVHDTQGMSHVLDSSGTHKLKELAMIDLGMSDSDEKLLRDIIIKLNRKLSAKLDWWNTLDIEIAYWLPKWCRDNHPDVWADVMDEVGIELGSEDENVCEKYGTQDGVRTSLLFRLYYRKLQERGDYHLYEKERKLIPCIYAMHHHTRGTNLIPKNFDLAHKHFGKEFDIARSKVIKVLGRPDFNPNSHPQLKKILFEEWDLPVQKRTDTQAPSTDADSIAGLLSLAATGDIPKRVAKKAVPFLEAFATYQSIKTVWTYLKSYSEHEVNNHLYFKFNQWGTGTTRLSSHSPNGQNIGAKEMDVEDDEEAQKFIIRSVFGPEKDRVWFSIDYNQLELRLMAFVSGDPGLNKVLNEGADQHAITRDTINAVRKLLGLPPILRKQAKNINFAWQYGASDRKLSAMAGIPAEEFNAAMRAAFPGVVAEMANSIAQARRDGFIRTLGGYRLTVPRNEPYKATNYKIQGSAGDIAKEAMRRLDSDHGLFREPIHQRYDTQLLLQIHDEFVISAHKSILKKPEVIAAMAHAISSCGFDVTGCRTPVKVSLITSDWSKAEEYKLAS